MNICVENHIKKLGCWFRKTGKPIYLVGGVVRNSLLGLAVHDIDVCAAVPPQGVKKIENAAFHVAERSYGLGTVVVTQGDYSYEYTAFRRDNYGRGGAHRPEAVCFTESMEEDALRRDFTINVLYAETGGKVIDPLRHGLADLQARVLRMVAKDTLGEDALRILRLVRFATQLGFSIDPETWEAAHENIDKLSGLSRERIRDEFFKILLADVPYGNRGGVLAGLHLLKELGAFAYIIPRLMDGDGFVQSAKYHKYDVMEHSLRACAAAPPDLVVRLAALLHDIAKPTVYKEDGNLYRHPQQGADMAGEALRGLHADNKLVQEVQQLVQAHMFDLDNTAREKAVARMIVRLGPEQFARLCDLREADFEGSGMGNKAASAQKWREALRRMRQQGAPLDRRQLAVTGNDLMRELGIAPGRQIGDLLLALQAYAIKKPKQNNYKSLIRCAKMMYTGRTVRKSQGR
ncbi:CCA tRNA nucleotidyltransferase [Christensenellaceae bacterium OttesenSCG-928-K19]|nr:CCA tRNA nucleotidyltransferase [Christensenellaceae bacterium OttesenSCG-928-K19]